jgi:hypothetical protein
MSLPGSCLLQTVLFGTDFRAVDEPLFSAVNLFLKMHGQDSVLPHFVAGALRQAEASAELSPKRASWLVLSLLLPQVPSYVLSHSAEPEKAGAFFRWLEQDVERLFHGSYGTYESPLNEFVAAAQLYYNSI